MARNDNLLINSLRATCSLTKSAFMRVLRSLNITNVIPYVEVDIMKHLINQSINQSILKNKQLVCGVF